MFRIDRNTFYNRKNKIPMKIQDFKRSGIGLIAEFRGIPNGFPNQDLLVKIILKYHTLSIKACIISHLCDM
jgi:hypothetical protein